MFENLGDSALSVGDGSDNGGGVATSVWEPPRPTLAVVTDLPVQDVYEVQADEEERRCRLVAAVGIVSPANKDRPEHRRAFVAKCAGLLREQVSVVIVDVVTTRTPSLYGELLDLFGKSDPALEPDPRCFIRPRAGSRNPGMIGCWKRGPMPWTLDSRCRRCRSGSLTTLRCPWSWSRAAGS